MWLTNQSWNIMIIKNLTYDQGVLIHINPDMLNKAYEKL